MLSCLKSTHAFKHEFSSRFRVNYSDFKLTHITFNHGAYSLHLGLEQLKDKTIKLSTMSLALRSTIILEFLQVSKNKTQRFLCLTLSSVSYVVFVDPHQGNKDVMPSLLSLEYIYVVFLEQGNNVLPSLFSPLPITKAYMWSS